MKKLLIFCTFGVFATSLRPQNAGKIPDFDKGSWLFRACQANIRYMDAAPGMDTADNALANECLDYIGGFTDGVTLAENIYCTSQVSMGTMTRVYVLFMQEHPKLLDEYRGVGLMLALKANYPCPTTGK